MPAGGVQIFAACGVDQVVADKLGSFANAGVPEGTSRCYTMPVA